MCSALVPTGNPAAKATTRTSAPGNSDRRRRATGFTLLELMVVMLIVAIASGVVSVALRDAAQNRLEEEGARLASLLESARTQSRIVGGPVSWEPTREGGFHFLGLPATEAREFPTRWIDPDTRADIVGASQVLLGPEPLLPPQRVVLHLGDHQVAVGTDGLAPFEVVDPSTSPASPAR